MRFSIIAAALSAVCASAQQGAWTDGASATAWTEDATTQLSTMTTYYTTRTVMRVVETVYATKNSSTFASVMTVLSAAPTGPAANATTVLGTGAGHSSTHAGSATGSPVAASTNGAAINAGASLGLFAVAGLAGFLAL